MNFDRESMRQMLRKDEGFRSSAYLDSEGFLTIGIGRLIDSRQGGGISREEAEFLLDNDIREVMEALDHNLPWWKGLDGPRAMVMVNMCFNLGMDGLLGFKNTLKNIKAGNYEAAAEGMLDSKWATQVGARAHRLANIMRTGIFQGYA